jgi:anaerobic carbon-monoxide dehydrogenase iron sulfur subunit
VIGMADRIFITDSRVCTGCRTCEIICSLNHEGECNPEKSRIHILQQEERGLDLPVVCQQCRTPICRTVCTAKAISRDPGSGAMLVDQEKCTGCESCVFACYFGAINLRAVGTKHKAFICDLCGGDPMCVKFCDTHALSFPATEQGAAERKSNSMREALYHLGRSNRNSLSSKLLSRITEVRVPVARQSKGG